MVHFLGIFSPGHFRSHQGQEAPKKANFFGGLPDAAQGAVPMSRAEQDACSLAGTSDEPAAPRNQPDHAGKTAK